ncbi:hypothetical protein AGMMS49546_25930 [Spirochaetia bacterium]|nr:hypothetical protein AGMMS49546_25930 [Spirochaetia bacterium]
MSESKNSSAENIPEIKGYDFKHPDRFTQEQICTLSMIHETFAGLSMIFIRTMIEKKIYIRVVSIKQLTYGEFLCGLPFPAVIGTINMDPLPGYALLEISPNISSAILNIIFGGEGAVKEHHALTDIESNIMEGLYIGMLGYLRESWREILDLKPRLEQIDIDPRCCTIVPPTEAVVAVNFECRIGDIEGAIIFCLPYQTLYPVMDKLKIQDRSAFEIIAEADELLEQNFLVQVLDEIPVRVTVELGRTTQPLEKVKKIKKGTVIELEKNVRNPFDIFAGSICIGQGEVVLYNDTYVIRNIDLKKIRHDTPLPFYLPNEDTEKGNADSENKNGYPDSLDGIKLTVSAVLDQIRQPIKTLKKLLYKNSMLELSNFNGEQVEVFAGGFRIGSGEVLMINDNFGIRITKTEDKNDE